MMSSAMFAICAQFEPLSRKDWNYLPILTNVVRLLTFANLLKRGRGGGRIVGFLCPDNWPLLSDWVGLNPMEEKLTNLHARGDF